MDLGDGSAVRLTVSRYYTPTGRSIQKEYSNGAEDYFNESVNRFEEGELISEDSIKVVDSLKYTTPKGKIVYGGGGIVPDVFVALDTTQYIDRIHFTTINDFAFDYLDTHRDEFKGLTFEQFDKSFNKNNAIYKAYIKSIENNFHYRKEEDKEELINQYLKAVFAQQLFDANAYFKIINRDDQMIEKTIELNRKGKPISQ